MASHFRVLPTLYTLSTPTTNTEIWHRLTSPLSTRVKNLKICSPRHLAFILGGAISAHDTGGHYTRHTFPLVLLSSHHPNQHKASAPEANGNPIPSRFICISSLPVALVPFLPALMSPPPLILTQANRFREQGISNSIRAVWTQCFPLNTVRSVR